MKKIFYFRSSFFNSFLGCLLALLLGACKKDQELSTTDRPSVSQYIAGDPQLSLWRTAFSRCHLDTDTSFSDGGPYTFFCPVDSAFIAAGLTADSIGRYNPDSLGSLLRYHILSGKFSSQDIIGFVTANVSSLNPGFKPYITKNYFGIFLDGIGVTEGDLEMGDGVIQKISRVAFPPKQTVLQLIDSLPELSYFAAVIDRVPNFKTLLSQFQPAHSDQPGSLPGLTVLVPTNAAFQASTLLPSLDAINQADPNVLFSVMEFYFLNGFRFTSDFMGGYVPGHAQVEFGNGGSFKIDKDGITIIPDYPVGVPPRIVNSNQICTDGVVQEISEFFISD